MLRLALFAGVPGNGLAHFLVVLPAPQLFAFVFPLPALAERQVNFCNAAPIKVNGKRHQGAAWGGKLSGEFINFAAMQQQFARSPWLMVELMATGIRLNMQIVEHDLP